MSVRMYGPQVQVLLKKNIGRNSLDAAGKLPVSDRFKSTFKNGTRTLDLTPLLGQAGSVTVSKSIREPAGEFSIVLGDQLIADVQDSLYGLIEPMDVIEIRMAHDNSLAEYKTLPKHLPIMMRGFVSDIERTETMSPDGRPMRTISISGQDYGKIWQILQIAYLPNYTVGEQLLSYFKYAANYQPGALNIMTSSDFVGGVVDNVINTMIAQLRADAISGTGQDAADNPVQTLSIKDLTVKNGSVSPFGVNAWQGGTVYELLRYYGDVGAFNELFIEDREEGVAVVYRPVPYVDVNGDLIQSDATLLSPVAIEDIDILSFKARRTDANVANCFWVDAPRFQLNQKSMLQLFAAYGDLNSFISLDHRNCTPTLYGLRRMDVETQQGDATETTRGDGQDEALQNQAEQVGFAWIQKRRDILKKANWDNVVLETGALRLRGNEKIKPGVMLNIRRRNFESSAYAVQVEHTYVPYQGYFTNVMFERGTGFAERAIRQAGKDSPYLSEMRGRGA